MTFKELIQEKLPDCSVYIVTPTLRSDYEKVVLTGNQLTNHLPQLNINIVDDGNITSKPKGLHLNEPRSRHLAIIFLERIRKF